MTHKPIYRATDYGSNFNSTTILAALSDIGSNNTSLYLDEGTWTITTNLTFPINIKLVFSRGAILYTSSNSIVITINGEIQADISQIFDIPLGYNVIVLPNIKVAYAEWFGIDGTDDHLQINEALSCAKKVSLLATTYNVGQIVLVTNSLLIGQGKTQTILRAQATLISGNQIIIANNVHNILIKDLTLLGRKDTGVDQDGFRVYGDSYDIQIVNVRSEAFNRSGFSINSSHNIYIENCECYNIGVYFTAFMIGTMAGETVGIRNIKVNGLTLDTCVGDNLGMWNQGTATKVTGVQLSNIYVYKNYGMGIWGNGVDDIVLNNFQVIDTVGLPAYNAMGLKIETGCCWQVSNGLIKNLPADCYGVILSGVSKYNNLSNITCDTCDRGVAFDISDVTDNNFNNVCVKNSINQGWIIRDFRNTFTNCSAIDNGSAEDVAGFYIRCYSSSQPNTYRTGDIRFINCTAYTTGTKQTTGVYIDENVQSVFFKGCKIQGTIKAFGYSSAILNNLHGEVAIVRLRESVVAGTDYEIPVLSSIDGKNIMVTNAYLSFGSAITQNNTDYNKYQLNLKDSTGTNSVPFGSITTKAADGGFSATKRVKIPSLY